MRRHTPGARSVALLHTVQLDQSSNATGRRRSLFATRSIANSLAIEGRSIAPGKGKVMLKHAVPSSSSRINCAMAQDAKPIATLADCRRSRAQGATWHLIVSKAWPSMLETPAGTCQ